MIRSCKISTTSALRGSSAIAELVVLLTDLKKHDMAFTVQMSYLALNSLTHSHMDVA